VCTGADVEMITPGGESAFVSRMVRESIEKGTQCRSVFLSCRSRPSISICLQMVHFHVGENVLAIRRRSSVAEKLGQCQSHCHVDVLFIHSHPKRLSQIENYGITEFIQGQTRRWAIAWSFDDIRLPDVGSQLSSC
jgi:hypothetical protein